ncbi:MAG: invasion associated locus B family protein [Xanthobacteraceae bacterium]
MGRCWQLVFVLLMAALVAAPANAQQPAPTSAAPAAAALVAKPKPKPKPKPAAKPAPKPAAERPPAERPAAETARPAIAGGAQPKLLGQYADWGAYAASPGGKKVCFAISKPTSSETDPPNRPRNPTYMFISTRPADKVTNEVSIIIGYPFKPGSEASAQIGATTFALYTQQDGAWIKNAAEEAQMVDAMRGADAVIVKGESAKGTKTTDKFDLKGVSQALDKIGQDCK